MNNRNKIRFLAGFLCWTANGVMLAQQLPADWADIQITVCPAAEPPPPTWLYYINTRLGIQQIGENAPPEIPWQFSKVEKVSYSYAAPELNAGNASPEAPAGPKWSEEPLQREIGLRLLAATTVIAGGFYWLLTRRHHSLKAGQPKAGSAERPV